MSSMRNPTIGLLSWDYGRPKGGMGRSLQHVVQALRAQDIPVKILAPCPGESSNSPFLRFTGRFGGQILFSLLLPFVLRARIKSQAIERLILPVGPGGVLLLARLRVPATAIVYHTYAQQSVLVPGQGWKRIFCPFERRTLRRCQSVICFCTDTKQALIHTYGILPESITVLPHAIKNVIASPQKRQAGLCICIARLEARKGVDVLLRAWPTIIEHVPSAKLVVVGDGVMRKQIDRMIAATRNVERHLSVTDEELRELLCTSEVAFCPAYLEGFGLACAEAMAAGCVVIASDTDGLRSLMNHDVQGLLVPPGNAAVLAEAAISILSDEEQSRRLAAAGQKHIAQTCNAKVADTAFVDAVRKVCATL